jgi:hypothetical protein
MALKLIREYTEWQDLEVLTEDTTSGKKSYKIKGPFIQAEVKNRNGRVYGKQLLEREVANYNKDKIEKNNAMGELDHPPTPSINLDRVSHLVESLSMEGNDGMGVARILPTPTGKIAESLLESGVQLGVSSRGVGSLDGDKVNKDYRLLAIDIVADPSAPSAYVDGILENKEYIMEGNHIVEVAIEKMEERIANKGSEELFETLQEFFKQIKQGW